MTATTWTGALDAYEARLDAAADALRTGTPDAVAPFAPPADLGPMPADQVERAVALLDRTQDLTRAIRKAQTAVKAKLDAEPTTPRPIGQSRFDVTV
ncbi:hypothetical protein [Euzebya sp.]|uniref:hypothetical protein n=1 Tax=Euzebya sp. TaxID=1971409 RepID=UPI00351210F2